MRIAVDAMGGDHAPAQVLQGATQAAAEYGIDVVVVGSPNVVQPLLDKHPRLTLCPSTQVVAMDDHPAQAVRSKPDSSMAVSARLCKEGKADGWISAGNSGAIMATALFIQGRIRGVERPALGSIVPIKGGFAYFLDVGANVDSKPEHLVQFAVMGEMYYRATFGNRRPRVGLLSVGEEEIKGNELTREVYTRLKKSPVHFVGNVEGGDLFSGIVDVIVCDGFIGNVALKICEGLALEIFGLLKKSIQSSLASQVGFLFSRGALKGLKKTIDYTEYGGAPLLGVRGVCVIGHGRSNANAIKNAIRVAAGLARAQMNDKIEQELSAAAVHPDRSGVRT
jgi:glycerol-3-phosphate acyltransferase PlsX